MFLGLNALDSLGENVCERDRGPLRAHSEGITLLPNIQELFSMMHNRAWGWRGHGKRSERKNCHCLKHFIDGRKENK